MKGGYYAELSGLTQQQKQLLVERHLISRELAARSEGCAVLISRSQNASILFNEGRPSAPAVYPARHPA